jgi:hypothetical protein
MKKKEKKDLVQIIRDNPGCVAFIDNDFWRLSKSEPEPEGFDDWPYHKQREWQEAHELVTSDDDLVEIGTGYDGGCCYGGAILEALAVIVGIELEAA